MDESTGVESDAQALALYPVKIRLLWSRPAKETVKLPLASSTACNGNSNGATTSTTQQPILR